MNLTLRSARPSCCQELQVAISMVAEFNHFDTDFARALKAARWNVSMAGAILGISREAARQRLASLKDHLSKGIPGFAVTIRRGPKAREVSYDQWDIGGVIGVNDGPRER